MINIAGMQNFLDICCLGFCFFDNIKILRGFPMAKLTDFEQISICLHGAQS